VPSKSPRFAPIAIVARACVLPGALDPETLFANVLEKRDAVSRVPGERWDVPPGDVLSLGEKRPDRAWSDAGGYVRGFENVFDPSGFLTSRETIAALDPIFQWVLHCGRECLSGMRSKDASSVAARTGLVLGNLGFPTHAMARYAEDMHWRGESDVHPYHRFSSGMPALLAEEALGLGRGAFSLDAACASSLYAIKLACDKLHNGSADFMLAGAVQHADDLFLHVGFSALDALSRTGQSRPFHRDADGLLPAEGAALVLLERLEDAVAAGHKVLGVIRGVGLSNDGRGRGLLVPSEDGQARAMQAAYEMAGIDPRDVGLLECHATGTPIGDATELRSAARVFAQSDDLPVSSLKSNLGHLITVAGTAGLLKVLGAFEAGVRPPQIHTDSASARIAEFEGTPFRLLTEAEPWTTRLCAGVSAFGFGGNNAHLIVEAFDPNVAMPTAQAHAAPCKVAIVAIGARVGSGESAKDFSRTLLTGGRDLDARGEVNVALPGLKFPPADLAETLPQQLLALEAACEAARGLSLPSERTATVVGMGCDAEIARYGARWRASVAARRATAGECIDDAWLTAARDAFAPSLTAAAVLGTMPNMPANRISSQLDLRGPSFTVSSEETSGLVAMRIAQNVLANGEADAVIVGAVDLSHERVHLAALAALGIDAPPGDAAIAMVLERLDDARAKGHPVLAVIEPNSPENAPNSERTCFGDDVASFDASKSFGRPHAALGMLQAAAATVALRHRAHLTNGEGADPAGGRESIEVRVTPLLGAAQNIVLSAGEHAPFLREAPPRLYVYRGVDRVRVLESLASDRQNDAGAATLVIVAASATELSQKRESARRWMEQGGPQPDGIAFREAPLRGELAFVFTGAGAAYSGMGRDLFLAFPSIFSSVAGRMGSIPGTWLTWPGGVPADPLDQLWGASLLTQAHANITLGTLGLEPTAAIGYSSGESNALFAFGAWNDIDGMIADGAKGTLFQADLCASHDAAHAYARRIGKTFTRWTTFSVAAGASEVRDALDGEPLAFLSIVNAPGDCVIAGDADACERVVEKLGAHRAMSLDYDMIAHCPVVGEVRDAWRALHRRDVRPVSGVRFYSNGSPLAFSPTSDSAADAITAQALSTLDFPSTIERAYADGVRIFVEHGPRGRATSWVKRILGDREHVALTLDVYGRSSLRSIANAIAGLVAAGIAVDAEKLFGGLRTEDESMTKADAHITFAAHAALVQLPQIDRSIQVQVPAPALASVLDDGIQDERSMSVGEPISVDPPGALYADAGGVLYAELAHQLAVVHAQFMQHQMHTHTQFLRTRETAMQMLLANAPVVSDESSAPVARTYPGPFFDRKDLEHLASGTISTLFGPEFREQDQYARQVRMPEPPLLLADRVLGIDGVPASQGTGTIWTETDVRADSWYLNAEGRMPAGIMIESGQADLLLCSWLGADLLNRGERVYRLLGCELTYHGPLPTIGETLHYEIHLDGHAVQGDVRLFFFRYDCFVGGALRLSVRSGQAGFFTTEELASSAGILWDPLADAPAEGDVLAEPTRLTSKRSLTRAELESFANGDVAACFGEGFESARAHVRSPRISGERMLFLDRVTDIDVNGGPWGRGYLRGEADISPDDWYFDGHFKNDPCMPGTLMFEGCVQTLSVYLAALGFTIERDGYRFEPVPDEKLVMRCRGQVTPASKNLVYEVFVAKITDGDTPTITADLLCTVDGRKAFHARRVSLRLVPDWPLERWQDLAAPAQYQAGEPLSALTLPSLGGLVGYQDSGPVAESNGFRFDYRSLLACAWGKPSNAFGPFYEVFDSPRRVARLPGPPYHFMSRISKVEGAIGANEPGLSVEVVYDVPESVWYFDENGHRTMPFCVLMEAALQPCGWLASYAGCARASDTDVLFRNLDGTGTLTAEVLPTSGALTTRAKLTRLSQSAGMIIVAFDVECFLGETSVYRMDTVFGFFPKDAFKNQAGLSVSAEHRARAEQEANVRIDLATRPKPAKGPRLADSMLLMIDRITGFWPDGGKNNLGYLRGEKDVDPGEWFFKAHFFQDPVQPGSLGVEALCQLLQFFMLESGMVKDLDHAHFEPVTLGSATKWKYRGQVVPENKLITSEAEILQVGTDEHGPFVVANAWLWVDGKRIYQVENLGMRVRSHSGEETREREPKAFEETLDPSRDAWLADHCPTYTVPALPMMSMVDRLVYAASSATGRKVLALTDVQVARWLPVTQEVKLRTELDAVDADHVRVTLEAFRHAKNDALSRFETICSAVAHVGDVPADAPAAWTARTETPALPNPYEDATLFHGPAFQYLTELRVDNVGASAVLDASRGSVPKGFVNQGLLDALTHAIPHTALSQWSQDIDDGLVAYPYRIDSIRFFEALPDSGLVRVEARFDGLDDTKRFPRTTVQAIANGRVAVELTLTEVLVPKGPIGKAPARERRAFLSEKGAPHVGLGTRDGDATRVRTEDVIASDWFPGTMASAYGLGTDAEATKVEQIAVREHVADKLGVHPSFVTSDLSTAESATHPLRKFSVDVQKTDAEVVVRDRALSSLDTKRVKDTWRRLTGVSHWPMEDLYASMVDLFVGDVVLVAPKTAATLMSSPCLFVANHQVGVESVLASVLLTTLYGRPTSVLAKDGHRDSWIGKLIAENASYPNVRDPELTLFVERDDPAAMVAQFASITEALRRGERSAMVHIEGTRSLSCRTKTTKLSSALVDIALAANVPIVPLRFVGGLPVEPALERLEFPVGFGKQTYFLGAPISPETLSSLPLRERKDFVLDALNALGVSPENESPCPPNAALEREIDALRMERDLKLTDAVLLTALMRAADPSDATRRLQATIHGAKLDTSDAPADVWLRDFARAFRLS
jgi:acyl transferase domain-containing protein/3-hydroxymyristoyl/3-hydroxydecanoyl-(acyl carrier protein) dehydratase/1-acyl-sn-glycerol-3-phosphate acyltransferase